MNGMNAEKRRPRGGVRRSGVGTGTTSLLMIFTVLCFATLAMLSLSTAASNERIQNRGLDGNQRVATAKGEAAAKVAELDAELMVLQEEHLAAALTAEERQGQSVTVLHEGIIDVVDGVEYEYREPDLTFELTPEQLLQTSGFTQQEKTAYFSAALALAEQQRWQTNSEDNTISLVIDLQNGSQLFTQLQLLEPNSEDGPRYAVLTQQTQLINGWSPEEGGQLWVPS